MGKDGGGGGEGDERGGEKGGAVIYRISLKKLTPSQS
jgi:hypothetical protein